MIDIQVVLFSLSLSRKLLDISRKFFQSGKGCLQMRQRYLEWIWWTSKWGEKLDQTYSRQSALISQSPLWYQALGKPPLHLVALKQKRQEGFTLTPTPPHSSSHCPSFSLSLHTHTFTIHTHTRGCAWTSFERFSDEVSASVLKPPNTSTTARWVRWVHHCHA